MDSHYRRVFFVDEIISKIEGIIRKNRIIPELILEEKTINLQIEKTNYL